MSRFGNLEFGGESPSQPRHERAAATDEALCLAEAKAAFEAAEFERALRLFGRVLEFNPNNTRAWTGQVRMLIELAEYSEARKWADKALERYPGDPELMAAKAVALARDGDLEGGLSLSDASIEERGDTPYVWLARGDVLLARREARADYCFEKALLLAPGDWFVAWLAGRIRCFYEQFSLGLKLLQQSLEFDPSHFVVWLETGRCQQALGLMGPARLAFAQAVQLNPHCEEAKLSLARLSRAGLFSRLAGAWRRLVGK